MSKKCHEDAARTSTPHALREAQVALVGRPNAGKSSLYNRVTGGDARVGNFPGITVEILSCDLRAADGTPVAVVDLPGLYTLTGETDSDEGVARRWLDEARAREVPTAIVQVLDGTQLALGLRLTRELITFSMPLVVAVSQYDLVTAAGQSLDVAALSRALGVPVITLSARDADARDVLLGVALDTLRAVATQRTAPSWEPVSLAAQVMRGREAHEDPLRVRTERIDRVLLHPVWGLIAFTAIMAGLFAALFLVAEPVSSTLEDGIHVLATKLGTFLPSERVRSFVSDGLLGGAGTVLAFLPQIVILTLAMELLDASGYLARGVFLVDRLLRMVGLGGRAFVPMLTAHACAVPAVTATRILRDPRERLVALLVLPLMTCSARIPTYGLLIAAFFASLSPLVQALIFVALYVAGIVAGALAASVLRRSFVRGRPLPLVLEMPTYRTPDASVVLRAAWRTVKRFVTDVGTTIVMASAVLWVLLSVPAPWNTHTPADAPVIERSVAASIGRAIEPVSRLAGFDWRINVGLMGSFGARELMVGTLGVIHGIEDTNEDAAPLATRLREARAPDGRALYGAPTGLALMAFFVLACQCMSTVAALRRETGTWRWPAFVLAYTYILGFAVAVVVYQVACFYAR
jgi:ferrous iron transport protein B